MKLENFLKKWENVEIRDDGSVTSDDYKKFQRGYKSVLTDISPRMELYSFSNNHYCFSAVMKSNVTDRFYYISISDVRYFNNEWNTHVLYRTMEHDKDWHGGYNHYSSLSELGKNLEKLDKEGIK